MSGRYCPSMSTKRAHSPDPIRSIVVQKFERAGISKPQIQATCSSKKIFGSTKPPLSNFQVGPHPYFQPRPHRIDRHPHVSTFDHVRMPHSPSRTTRMTHNLISSARPQLLYRPHPVSTTNTFVRFLCMYAYARSH